MVDVQPKDMSHLRKRSETTLGCATADRAVADGPNSAAVSRRLRRGNGRVLLDSLEHCLRGGVETRQRP